MTADNITDLRTDITLEIFTGELKRGGHYYGIDYGPDRNNPILGVTPIRFDKQKNQIVIIGKRGSPCSVEPDVAFDMLQEGFKHPDKIAEYRREQDRLQAREI